MRRWPRRRCALLTMFKTRLQCAPALAWAATTCGDNVLSSNRQSSMQSALLDAQMSEPSGAASSPTAPQQLCCSGTVQLLPSKAGKKLAFINQSVQVAKERTGRTLKRRSEHASAAASNSAGVSKSPGMSVSKSRGRSVGASLSPAPATTPRGRGRGRSRGRGASASATARKSTAASSKSPAPAKTPRGAKSGGRGRGRKSTTSVSLATTQHRLETELTGAIYDDPADDTPLHGSQED